MAAAAASAPIPVQSGEFEGPLDLLLELVRRNQVSIETMPIADITRQYLAYLKDAERASVNLGAEFIYMAATLIQIKSRLLLPQDPALAASGRRHGGAQEEDPHQALLDRLREHAQARAAAEMLKTKLEVEETSWTHHHQGGSAGGELGVYPDTLVVDRQTAAPRQATLADLIDTLGDALRRVRNHTTIAVEMDTVTVEERIQWLREAVIGNEQRRLHTISDLFLQQPSAAACCCLFLGILELGRDGQIHIDQAEPFGEVTIGRAS